MIGHDASPSKTTQKRTRRVRPQNASPPNGRLGLDHQRPGLSAAIKPPAHAGSHGLTRAHTGFTRISLSLSVSLFF